MGAAVRSWGSECAEVELPVSRAVGRWCTEGHGARGVLSLARPGEDLVEAGVSRSVPGTGSVSATASAAESILHVRPSLLAAGRGIT